jgi:cell division protein FtsW
VLAGLVVLQPDLGTAALLVATAAILLFVAGISWRFLAVGAAVALPIAWFLVIAVPYRRARLFAFLDPERDPLGSGFQALQSLIAVGSGGLFGLGPGNSVQKLYFLPSPHADFIFAIIAEELGLIGALLVIGLFLGFAVFGTRAALHAPDRFGMLIASGITAWILAQAFVNIGGVVGILPITGLTLPFVSFGGTSLVVTMGAAGMLLNVAANGRSRV